MRTDVSVYGNTRPAEEFPRAFRAARVLSCALAQGMRLATLPLFANLAKGGALIGLEFGRKSCSSVRQAQLDFLVK